MKYYFTNTTKGDFDAIETKVIMLLKDEGFGVLTQIDIKNILKNKLNVDFKKYKILGACNPSFAHKALLIEDQIGTMLPCNIILQEVSPNVIEVSAINPIKSMESVNNKELNVVAKAVSKKLEKVIESINDEG
jgi:uncharacterized protein (DUF302 family)